jgi:hypothetical protein
MNEETTPAAPKRSAGFFQVALEALHRISKRDGGANEMAAYLVLCSGVNGRHADRLCTHGANSIRNRTGMSYRSAEKALGWLQAEGLIRAATPEAPEHLGKNASRATRVRWVVTDLDGPPDVAISRQFIDGVKGSSKDAPIKRMLEEISGCDEVTRSQAVMDAMMTFVALMKEQDFGDCAGVDPDAWHQTFEPIEPGDVDSDSLAEHIAPLAGTNGVIVTVKEAKSKTTTWAFVFRALGEAPADEEIRARFSVRYWHAISQLRRLSLVYRVLVLWDGDPLDPKQRRKAEPLATQYINDAWARKIDPHLQYEANRAVWRSDPEISYEDFGAGNEGEIPFVGSGRYRYIVKSDQARKTHLVGQLRVRYWPANDSTVQGRNREASRTKQWEASIASLNRRRP